MWTVAAASIIGAILHAASSVVFVDRDFAAAAPVQAGTVWPLAVDWSGVPEMYQPHIPRFNKFDR